MLSTHRLVGRGQSYSNSPDVRERVLAVAGVAAEDGRTGDASYLCYQ